MHSNRSRGEIEDAIRTLPIPGLERLRRVAAVCCLGRPLDAEDLLQEAFARAINGSRKCPVHVDVVTFLAEAMHSIASDAAKAQARHPERRAFALVTENALTVDPPDCRPNAAEALESDDEVRHMKQAIVALFADDPVAQVMVEGIMEDMEGEELREVTGLSKIAFASKRRLIRRRIETAFPDGWTP